MAVAQWTNRLRDFTEMPEEESVGKERGGGGGGGEQPRSRLLTVPVRFCGRSGKAAPSAERKGACEERVIGRRACAPNKGRSVFNCSS